MAKLNAKQKLFADNYIISLNAYDAAIKAGYSESYAKAKSYLLLDNVGIKNYIQERMESKDNDIVASQDEVLAHLTAVMRDNVTEEVVVTCGTGEGTSQPVKVKKNTAIKDRIKAAELLGKRYGLFKDKIEADISQQILFSGEDDLID
jgi:phage terminase small subunit|nr:MAG TPA: Terminase small subunit [Caudoviricetes sp.]